MNRRRKARKKTAIDLFAGCGGLTEGLRQAGFRVLGAIEISELAAKTYRLNHKGVRLWNEDIRDVAVSEVIRTLGLSRGELDLLAGCPPCQGFSALRTLNGNRRIRDRRNLLIDDFLRFVRNLMPKTIMLENVPGLGSRERFRAFVRKLRGLGYDVSWKILDAADYGVPQRRRRLILLASRGITFSFAKSRRTRKTVGTAIRHLPHPDLSSDPLHKTIGQRSQRINELIKLIPKNGGSRAELPRELWLECHKRANGFKDVYGRLCWTDLAPTITGGCLNPSKGRFLHPTQNRAITPKEAALLQSFRRSYRFSRDSGMYAVAEMIGNALPPEFVRRHALQLVIALKAHESLQLVDKCAVGAPRV